MATISGITDFGTLQQNGGPRGIAKGVNKPGFLMLQTTAAGVIVNYWLWVDSTGVLRISNAVPTDQDNNGTVVGSQS